jgi:hypothetical protein
MSSSFKSNAASSLPKRSSEQQHSKTSSKPATISKPSSTHTAPKPKTTTSTTTSNASSAVPKQAQEPQLQGGGEDAVYVRSLLDEMQGRFDAISKQIISKIDSVGSKVDALDAEITELMREAGVGDVGSEGQEDKLEMGQAAAGNELEEETTMVGKAGASILGQEPISE